MKTLIQALKIAYHEMTRKLDKFEIRELDAFERGEIDL